MCAYTYSTCSTLSGTVVSYNGIFFIFILFLLSASMAAYATKTWCLAALRNLECKRTRKNPGSWILRSSWNCSSLSLTILLWTYEGDRFPNTKSDKNVCFGHFDWFLQLLEVLGFFDSKFVIYRKKKLVKLTYVSFVTSRKNRKMSNSLVKSKI